jgi:hypothetical protein
VAIDLDTYASFDGREREVRGDELFECGSVGKISNEINELTQSINSSVEIWCEVTYFESTLASTTCNHHVYTNNCQNIGTVLYCHPPC